MTSKHALSLLGGLAVAGMLAFASAQAFATSASPAALSGCKAAPHCDYGANPDGTCCPLTDPAVR